MAQPQWITPAGSLGTIPEGVFYTVPIQAVANGEDVRFRLIAGELPDGVQVTANGIVEGIPKSVLRVQGVPQEVAQDVTSRFAIRAFTVKTVDGILVVDRLADRTFSMTVTGQDLPEFMTPSGSIGTFYDGSEVSLQVVFVDADPNETVRIGLLSGQLPPGLVLDSRTGLISGVIVPLVDGVTEDFTFILEITDGKEINLRTFSILVYARASISADNAIITADNNFITADVIPSRTPILLTPPGDLGRIRADNFYAFKFDAIDFDGDLIEYSITLGAGVGYDADGTVYDEDGVGFDRGVLALPPGLVINQDTGWFYGYIPDQGVTEKTYKFAIRVRKANDPSLISPFYYFTITIIGQVDTEVTWITRPDLGTVLNGSISTLSVAAVNLGGRSLQYRLASGTNSRLPQGLTLQPSGRITGRVSFNTFALDGGTTTFDVDLNTRLDINETTFDSTFSFTVNTFAAETVQIGYQVSSINVINGGFSYTGQPTVTISAPDDVENAIQATAGVVTIVAGAITAIALGNPGRGYSTPPSVNITGGGGSGATASTSVLENQLVNPVSVFRRFTVTVDRYFNQPYEVLYVKCMPTVQDRAIINQLVLNQDIIPQNLVYRPDDPNFGVNKNVIYDHAYGIDAAAIDHYYLAMQRNTYWKNITLGSIRTAQALDSAGNVLYEVVYSQIIDDLVNDAGQSVAQEVKLPYPVELEDSTTVTEVYPNSLINMRNRIIAGVGQISPPLTPALPLWMTSKQVNGRVLGFVAAWVIAYINPGQSGRVAYNISQQFGDQLHLIDFKIDRYELDRSQTYNWLPYEDSTQYGKWIPYPPEATTFDQGTTIFDGNSLEFISPADYWEPTDRYDKYLLFRDTNILD